MPSSHFFSFLPALPPVVSWILSTGFWNDIENWNDTATWID